MFHTPPPAPLMFLDISLPRSKRGEEQTVIFGNDLLYINHCMEASFSRRNDDDVCDEQVFLLDAVSEWKDVSIRAEEDKFLSFVLICSVDDEF